MGATSKSTRLSPTARFEDYVLTYETGSSLFPVRNSVMEYLMGTNAYLNSDLAGVPGATGGDSYLDIGFMFPFDGKLYSKLDVFVSGWCSLVDPSNPTFIISKVLTGAENDNTSIKDVFSDNSVLVAPWFDSLRNCYRYVTGTAGGLSDYLLYGFPSSVSAEDISSGRVGPTPGIDATLGGIKFYRGNTESGRCLVIRWKSFTNTPTGTNSSYKGVVCFDVVFYESGQIEFRYAPIVSQSVITEAATIGIFSYGGSPNNPRYRDFGNVLKPDLRGVYHNGGSVYVSPFVDGSSKYTVSLNVKNHWPGRNGGGIFRFSPPRYRRRQNRSVVYMRDNSEFIRTGGTSLFNDQNSPPSPVANRPIVVEYPSMMPVSSSLQNFGGGPASGIDLFQSGSIQIVRTSLSPGLYDDVLRDSILSGKKR